MQKDRGRSLRHRLGFFCLLAGMLTQVSSGQSDAHDVQELMKTGFSPVQAAPAGGWLAQRSRVLPSHGQRMAETLRGMRERGAIHGLAHGMKSMPLDSATPSPNFGGFLGSAPTFPAAHLIGFQDASGSAVQVYNVSDVIAGDFNGDGNLDAAVIQVDGSIDTMLGDGKGGFAAPVVTQSPGSLYFEGNSAVSVDLNGDGKQDLVGCDGYQVYVWLSKGDGSFSAPVSLSYQYQSTANSVAFAVADANGDGHPDLLVVSGDGKQGAIVVQTLLNAGDGSFSTANIPTVSYPVSSGNYIGILRNTAQVAQIGGKTTLIFAAGVSSSYGAPYNAEILQTTSNGDGSFAFVSSPIVLPSLQGTGFNFGASGINTALLVADLNGDGAADILVAPGDSSIYSALGTGGNGFATPALASKGYYFYGPNLKAADLDGDGNLDLIDAESNETATFRGNGDGTFTLVNAFLAGAAGNSSGYSDFLTSTAYGDFNSDGRLDYFNVDNTYGQAGFYAGLGGFGFNGAPRLVDTGAVDQAPAAPDQLLIESSLDLNGDGKTDLFAFSESIGAGGYQLKAVSGVNKGGGQFQWVSAPSILSLPISYFGISQQTADFNHDGKEDLLLYGADGGSISGLGLCLNWYVYIALSNGDGTYQTPAQLQLPNQPACPNQLDGFSVADVNGDGNADIVFTYGNPGYASLFTSDGPPTGYYVALGDGTGKFPTVKFTPYGNSLDLTALADFNGDGFPDLAITNFPNGTNPSLSILLNDGTGNFSGSPAKPVSYTEYPVYLLAGDLSQDGKQDLIMASAGNYDANSQTLDSTTSGILIYPGNGDGTVGEPTLLNQGEGDAIALADFNGDGLVDIFAGLSYDFNTALPSVKDPYYGASLLLSEGGGKFAPPVNTYVPYGVTLLAPGNFYGDGATDAVVVDGNGATLLINQGGANLSLSASSQTVEQGDTVALTARVTASLQSRPVPTGKVTFYDGTASIGVVDLDSTGVADLSTAQLSAGSHSITASYTGDANFNPISQSSATVSVKVSALPPAFTLASSSSGLSITKSGSGALTLTLIPNATFSGNVALAATGLPTGVTAQFSPATTQLAAGQSAKVTLTIAAGSANAQVASAGNWLQTGTGVSVAGLLLLLVPRRRRLQMMVLVLVAGVLTATALTGCGGGSSSNSVKTGQTQITITATPSASGASTQATTVTLQVQ